MKSNVIDTHSDVIYQHKQGRIIIEYVAESIKAKFGLRSRCSRVPWRRPFWTLWRVGLNSKSYLHKFINKPQVCLLAKLTTLLEKEKNR